MSSTDARIERLERQVEMLLARVEALETENTSLRAENAELKRRLGENSSNGWRMQDHRVLSGATDSYCHVIARGRTHECSVDDYADSSSTSKDNGRRRRSNGLIVVTTGDEQISALRV